MKRGGCDVALTTARYADSQGHEHRLRNMHLMTDSGGQRLMGE